MRFMQRPFALRRITWCASPSSIIRSTVCREHFRRAAHSITVKISLAWCTWFTARPPGCRHRTSAGGVTDNPGCHILFPLLETENPGSHILFPLCLATKSSASPPQFELRRPRPVGYFFHRHPQRQRLRIPFITGVGRADRVPSRWPQRRPEPSRPAWHPLVLSFHRPAPVPGCGASGRSGCSSFSLSTTACNLRCSPGVGI